MKRDYLEKQQDEKDFTKFIYAYSSFEGRERHSKSSIKSTPPIQGQVVITSENMLGGTPSKEGRLCQIVVPKRDPDITRGKRCIEIEKYYSGFKGRFISWILAQSHSYGKDIETNYELYQDEFYKAFGIADMRKSKMLAIRIAWFETFCDFMVDSKFMTEDDRALRLAEFEREIINRGKNSAEDLEQFEPANVFINEIKSLIASGSVVVGKKEPEKELTVGASNKLTVAWKDDGENIIYVLPDRAIEVVKRCNKTFNPDKRSLGATFKNKGWIAKFNNGYYYNQKVDGIPTQLWAFKGLVFGINNDGIKMNPKGVGNALTSTILRLKIQSQPTSAQFDEIIHVAVKTLGGNYNPKDNDEHRKTKEIEGYVKETAIPFFFAGKGWKVPEPPSVDEVMNEFMKAKKSPNSSL